MSNERDMLDHADWIDPDLHGIDVPPQRRVAGSYAPPSTWETNRGAVEVPPRLTRNIPDAKQDDFDAGFEAGCESLHPALRNAAWTAAAGWMAFVAMCFLYGAK
jgi:hypothetical protein